MNRQALLSMTATGLVALCATAIASEKSDTNTDAASVKTAATTSTSTVGASGMRVYLDPETGTLVDRPVTAEQKAAASSDAQELFNQDSSDLQEVRHPDGSVSMDLQGRFEMASSAYRMENGSVGYTCTDVEHAAQGDHTHTAAAPARDLK